MRTLSTCSLISITSFTLAAMTLWAFDASACDDRAYKFLDELPESFCDDGNVNAGTFGIYFRDLNRARVMESLHCEAMSFSNDEDFREALCKKLLDPDCCFAAYALLNQFYPECACGLVSDGFWGSPVGNSRIPVKMLSGSELIELRVDFQCFAEMSHRYWEKKLRIRSPTEKLLDENTPGWRDRLRIRK